MESVTVCTRLNSTQLQHFHWLLSCLPLLASDCIHSCLRTQTRALSIFCEKQIIFFPFRLFSGPAQCTSLLYENYRCDFAPTFKPCTHRLWQLVVLSGVCVCVCVLARWGRKLRSLTKSGFELATFRFSAFNRSSSQRLFSGCECFSTVWMLFYSVNAFLWCEYFSIVWMWSTGTKDPPKRSIHCSFTTVLCDCRLMLPTEKRKVGSDLGPKR